MTDLFPWDTGGSYLKTGWIPVTLGEVPYEISQNLGRDPTDSHCCWIPYDVYALQGNGSPWPPFFFADGWCVQRVSPILYLRRFIIQRNHHFKFMVDCQGIRYTHKLLELLAFEHSLIVQSYSPLLMFHHQELVRDAPWIGLGDNSGFFHDCWWFRNPAASRIDIPSLKLTQHLKICRNPKREV